MTPPMTDHDDEVRTAAVVNALEPQFDDWRFGCEAPDHEHGLYGCRAEPATYLVTYYHARLRCALAPRPLLVCADHVVWLRTHPLGVLSCPNPLCVWVGKVGDLVTIHGPFPEARV